MLALRDFVRRKAVVSASRCYTVFTYEKRKQQALEDRTVLEQRAEACVRKTKREFTGAEINAGRIILLKALIVDDTITNTALK